MGSAEDLMQRLAVSKKIMEKTEQIKNVDGRKVNIPMVEEFQPVNATYNLPQEFVSEQNQQKNNYDPTKPLDENKILNSKLPDEIKRLMIEQPIIQPSSMGGQVEISDEVIQGAQRLMNMGKTNISDFPNKNVSENISITEPKTNHNTSNINLGEMKSMIRDVVRDAVRDVVREELKEAGMLVESTTNSNEVIQFKVGQHLFLGKVTKIKKLEK
jgi:hypothetical protein